MAISIEEAFDAPSYSVNETVYIVEHNADPRVNPGYAAPVGSLLLDSVSGDHYNKFGTQNTDWNLMTEQNGKTIQLLWGTIPEQLGTAIIPLTTGLPSITAGTELWSQSITPESTSNLISITTSFSFAASSNEMPAVVCLFRDNNCVAASLVEGSANPDVGRSVSFTSIDMPFVAGTSITYSCRIGKLSGGGVWYVNSTQSYSSIFGGALSNTGYQVAEITA